MTFRRSKKTAEFESGAKPLITFDRTRHCARFLKHVYDPPHTSNDFFIVDDGDDELVCLRDV